ncbi:hypothetical protein PIB30_044839 [Stylosanthes scabra]|uniref:Uncharacterized protein n=1 Tax=Stylosanthes scabra TaxID=79078 RepID=A0ABU6YES2_9FABA|nr:hypothetical protein [Stylosanthes scabra]
MGMGYTLYTYNSLTSTWSNPVDAPAYFWTMSEHLVVVGRRTFWLNLTRFHMVPYSIIGYCIDTDFWVETIIPPHAIRGSSSRLAVDEGMVIPVQLQDHSGGIM